LAIEDEGLAPLFVDANDDPFFDETRDATGCDVVDQSPAAGEVAAEGDEVEITIDCAQVDWENQEGSDWAAFNDAYSIGFDDGCQAVFDVSPDGSLYEDDYEYTAFDCQNLNPGDASYVSDVPVDVPDDAEAAGAELGQLDGCQALFNEEGVWSLNWGETSITVDDCPIGGYRDVPRARERTSKPGTNEAKRAGGTCLGEQADGTPITMQVEIGKVNCAGAEALWQAFQERAPTEGVGSSGYLELDGWSCAGAPAVQAPRAGSCERLDEAAAFTVYTGE
jgi:hypothetical protein